MPKASIKCLSTNYPAQLYHSMYSNNNQQYWVPTVWQTLYQELQKLRQESDIFLALEERDCRVEGKARGLNAEQALSCIESHSCYLLLCGLRRLTLPLCASVPLRST